MAATLGADVRILHLSDTHGPIPWAALPTDFDLLAHTGDWMPEGHHVDRGAIACYQMEFLRYEGAALAARLQGRPFRFCLGNHDLLSEDYVERELRDHGVECGNPQRNAAPHEHSQTVALFDRLRETPFIDDSFEGGLSPSALAARTRSARRPGLLPGRHSVLLAHCPPSGALSERDDWGNPELARILDWEESAPSLVLCGHIHSQGGQSERWGRTLVVNSARTWTLLSLEPGGVRVVNTGGEAGP